MTSKKNTKGFSLVELAIVVVIIGLIVAGVTAGQELVKQAKHRAVLSEVNKFRSAFKLFRSKYNALPGDMPNAYDYWGANCDATPSNCNGDGNRVLGDGSGNDSEGYRAWQHLTLSGILPGTFTGTATGTNCVLDVNTYAGAIASSGYYFSSTMPSTVWVSATSAALGKCVGTGVPNTALLVPQDAYHLDLKSDDGLPNAGATMSHGGLSASGACNGIASNTDPYTLSNTGIACYTFFSLE